MQKLLLIGASGQLGAALVRALGDAVVAVPRAELDLITVTADVAAGVVERYAPDAVLCVAGATDVERCEREPAWATAVNTTGPLTVARASGDMPFVYVSTDYVFDGESGPYAEDDAVRPLNEYGKSKLAAERGLLDTHAKALVVRTTGVFGPDVQGKNFLYTLRRVLNSGGTMRVPNDQISNPSYNEDLAAAIVALVRGGASGVFHAAGPEMLSRYAFAERAAGISGLNTAKLQAVKTAELGQTAARPLRSGLRTEKLVAALGAQPFRPLDAAIAAFAEYVRGAA